MPSLRQRVAGAPERRDRHPLEELRRIVSLLEQTMTQQADSGVEVSRQMWSRVPVLDNIEIAVRGVAPEDAALVEELAQKLREAFQKDEA